MSRQVLTYPDMPPVLTQSAGDLRYLQPSQADALYFNVAGDTVLGGGVMIRDGGALNIANTAFTISGGWKWDDALGGIAYTINGSPTGTRFDQNASLFVNGTIVTKPGAESLSGWWLDGTDATHHAFIGLEGGGNNDLWRIYSPPKGNILNLNLANGDLTHNGHLTVNVGTIYANGGGVYCTNNNLFLYSANNNVQLHAGAGYVHPGANNTVNMGHPGLRWATTFTQTLDAAGEVVAGGNVTANGGIVRSGSGAGQFVDYRYDGMWKNTGDLLLDAGPGAMIKTWTNATAIAPAVHGGPSCGTSSLRWSALWTTAGAINSSSIADKDPLGDLDPDDALRAVLRTPARRFRYKGADRVQHGYYLEEADPLFTIGPNAASPSNDTGILLAAIQSLSSRLDALEAARV